MSAEPEICNWISNRMPLDFRLMPEDFKAFTKIKIDNQSFNKENMPSHFKASSH